jgi:hypothetical protein
MGQGDFGFSSLNNNLNPNNNNGFNISTLDLLNSLIVPVRVIDILLSENDFKRFDGDWNILGAIKYELVTNPGVASKTNNLLALPLNPNIKNYPLINEIVYLINLPNNLLGENKLNSNPYYINIVSLWNHPHHNAYPSKANEPNPPQQKDYIETQAGSAKIITNNAKQVFLGSTFVEKPNIHPLLPFEGDIIYEGRWGNSIRLGSTVQSAPNNWSSSGNNGDPITIIRNGQGEQTQQGWIPVIENINNDDSSIYLTSTQNIPIEVSSDSYVSYDKAPESPSKFNGSQIILNSGRLVFNTWGDHILLSSAKSINLNAVESVNIDTKKFITQADQIFLGKEDLAKEPLLLGNTTAQLLRDLNSSVKELATALQNLQSAPVAVGSPAVFPTLLVPCTKVLNVLDSLNNQLGSTPDGCTITSKRNYTV